MKLNIYALFDSKALAFQRPFFVQTDGVAKRAIFESAQDRNSELHKYPTDYALFYIGEYDDQTGELIGMGPRNLGLVSSVIESYSQPQLNLTTGETDAVSDATQLQQGSTGGNSKKHV